MASPAVTTTYILTVTNLTTSCENTDTVTVFVNPLPPVTMPPFGSVCIGDSSFVLTGGSPIGGTYSGTGVYNGFFHPDSSGIGPHTIINSYTDSNFCSNTAQQILSVNPLPFVNLGNDTIEILFDPCTGIHFYINNPGVNVYPNPNHGVFKIVITNINNKNLKYILYDLSGKKVFNETVTDIADTKFEKEIHLSDLSKGIYILKVEMDDEFIIKKVLVE